MKTVPIYPLIHYPERPKTAKPFRLKTVKTTIAGFVPQTFAERILYDIVVESIEEIERLRKVK